MRRAAEAARRSVDWVRRQYRAGSVSGTVRRGRYGPERLVDVKEVLARAGAHPETRAAPPPDAGDPPFMGPSLLVLAETLHDLARQLGEAQARAARAEADAAQLRQRLAEQGQTMSVAEADRGYETMSEDERREPFGASGSQRLNHPLVLFPPDESNEEHADDQGPRHRDDDLERLWLGANTAFLHALPDAAARKAAGERLRRGPLLPPPRS
jgi:hypothetical protein